MAHTVAYIARMKVFQLISLWIRLKADQGFDYCNVFLACCKAIPTMGFDDNLQPVRTGNNRCLLPTTMGQYVGFWLTEVRDKFPQHEYFKDSFADYTGMKPTILSWWTDMRNGISQIYPNAPDDFGSGLDTLHFLYKDNGKPTGDVIANPMSPIDVKTVLLNLVSHAK
jgi:hypothetical protein